MGKFRRSHGKTSKETEDAEETSNSSSLQMELDLLSLKAKNSELTRAHAKLIHNLQEARKEIDCLRIRNIDLEAKLNAKTHEIFTIKEEIKQRTPSLLNLVNLMLHFSDGEQKRLSDGELRSSRAITQAVKPHTVNGTVLNWKMPRISLMRAPDNSETADHELPSCSGINEESVSTVVPSTSRLSSRIEDDESDSDDEGLDCMVTRRRTSVPAESVEDDDDEVAEEHHSMQDAGQLSVISEESMCSSPAPKRRSLGEVRIRLSRLPIEELQSRQSYNDSCSSLDANVNDTFLNIETTVIENQSVVGKTLMTDIRVFTPCGSSSRIDQSLNRRSSGGRQSLKGAAEIQSSEISPTDCTFRPNEESEIPDSSPTMVPWIPTPSMSVLGDINKLDQSRLEILTEDRSGTLSPIPHNPSPVKRPRTKSRRREASNLQESSPVSARSSDIPRRTVFSSVCQERGSTSSHRILTASVVLERMENISNRSSSSFLTRSKEGDSDEPNENIPRNRLTTKKSAKNKKRSGSPNPVAKRLCEDNNSSSRMKELQVKLWNTKTETDVEMKDSDVEQKAVISSGRPQRAAKPTVLKDASLKVKMRRMF